MRISAIGDPYIYWPELILEEPQDAFPLGKWLSVFTFWGPGKKRKFMCLTVEASMEPLIGYCLAVEYETGDKQVAELAHGGGISWTDYFRQYDKLMLITSRLGPGSTSTLVDTSIYERKIRALLDPFSNTGAWDHYHQFAKSVYADLTPESPEWKREQIMEIWDKYVQDCERWFPGKKFTAA